MKRIALLLSPLVILLTPIIDAFQGVYIDPRSDAGYAVITCVAMVGLALGVIATFWYKRRAVGNVITAGTLAVTIFLFGDLSYGVFWKLGDHIGIGGAAAFAFAGLVVLTLILFRLMAAVPRMMAAFAVALLGSTILDRGLVTEASAEEPAPAVIYIVTDEMIGISGIDTRLPNGAEAKAALSRVFQKYGFRLHSKAFSRHILTQVSVPAALNMDYSYNFPGDGSHYAYPGEVTTFKELSLFSLWHRQGLGVNVFQSAHLDYCQTATLVECHTFASFDGTRFIQRQRVEGGPYRDIPPASASLADVKALVEGNRQSLAMAAVGFVASNLLKTSETAGQEWHPRSYDQLAFPYWLGQFQNTILDKGRGNAFFAHFLFPHSPAVYNKDCKPTNRWLDRSYLTEVRGLTGQELDAAREKEYGFYFAQTLCLARQLDKFFNAVLSDKRFQDATIIVHGDHGSRISAGRNVETMSPRDYVDNYSALYAVRKPGVATGTDYSLHSVQWLNASLFRGNVPEVAPTVVGSMQDKSGEPAVYAPSTDPDHVAIMPMHDFDASH
ncbi:nodulation protein NoeB [Sinorhizobium meliloti]|uniref:sulfatase-like hydrolase/transferase n=1 Tax=Rhizobium meliloti TaxID=382 RepID=UPI000FDBD273|nr:sulfatase-like hydrolase/transferase [Sinorhizobium meliloti]RVE95801.1 nodulation protein NoeB [Sinorhizobium meliloti]RVH38815.1 nodulation protein NoeB [Sinorhizobium meliloti]RVK08046.1 nodulation protein NoeB [Sinorhizobium meliloti]